MCDDRLFIIMYGFIVSYYVVSYHKMVERKVLQLGKRSPGMYVLYHTEQYNLLKNAVLIITSDSTIWYLRCLLTHPVPPTRAAYMRR